MSITVTKRPYSKSFSGNPVYYQLYSALAAGDTTIYFEIQVKFKAIGGSYVSVLDTPIPFFPVSGYADVDIKDILHAQLDYGLIEFSSDETMCWYTTGQSGYFYLEFREITTANTNPSWDSTESAHECFVVKGGLNYFLYRGNNWWANYQPVQKPFLTWQKSGRKAALAERMYLAFLQLDTLVSLTQKITVGYTDGTTAGATHAMTAAKDAVHYIPAGATQLDLASITPGKTIYYWDIWLVNESNVAVSETFRYYLDNQNTYNGVTLHYRNSLGGLDSVRIRGEIEESASYNYTEQETALEPDYFSGSAIQPQRRIGDNTEQISFKGNTGPLTRDEQDRLRDAFVNREVWQEIDKKWWPVVIITKSFTLRKSSDKRWSLPLEWELAYTGGDYYTPKNVALGDGVFTDNVCLARLGTTTIAVDATGSDAAITFEADEIDPQSASTQFQYRIEKTDGTLITDWTTAAYSDFPITVHVAKEATYWLKMRSLCTGGVVGVVSSMYFTTVTTVPDGGGGTPPDFNSLVNNLTGTSTFYVLKLNGVTESSGFVGAYNDHPFYCSDVVAADVTVDIGFSAASIQLYSNGNTYTPDSIVGNQAIFSGVSISSGLEITIS